MTKQQEEDMNDFTVYEARTLYATNGLVTICGNGQVTHFADKDKLKEKEQERCENGY